MSRPEKPVRKDCVPVSKAENPDSERVLPLSNSDTTPGVSHNQPQVAGFLGGSDQHGTLRQRAERRLFELEAMAELMAADVGPATPRGRLLAARYAAARALFLEVLETYQPNPSTWHEMGSPWDRQEETGLLGRLCQRHGWRAVRPGLLARIGGPSDG